MYLRLIQRHSEANDCPISKKRVHHVTSALISIFLILLAAISLDVAVLIVANHLVEFHLLLVIVINLMNLAPYTH